MYRSDNLMLLGREKKILVVEDDADIRESFLEVLESEGYTVQSARHGKEALELLQGTEAPDLIFLDLMMPVMTGWEFLDAINSDQYRVPLKSPVVVVSAVADPACLSCIPHVKAVIAKPTDMNTLLDTVSYYCH